MRRRGLMIIWPQYFDRNRPVRLGRRVPIKESSPDPTVQDLVNAVKLLGYPLEINATVKYPATWWDEPGNVLVETSGQKKNGRHA